jgi:hypothetical protein
VRDILIRAAKTFVETFLAAFPVSAALSVDIPALEAAAFAAGAAALAILWNSVLTWAQNR